MSVVTLIGTVHQERGRVTAFELSAILNRIRPQVVFIEAPSSLRGSPDEISKIKPYEAAVAIQYLKAEREKLIPVDLHVPTDAYLRDLQRVLIYVERVSEKYCRLIDKTKESMATEGFSYLNGGQYESMQLEMHNEVLRILELRNDPSLCNAYKSWRSQDARREIEMVTNIEKYGRENRFDRAVFLFGAAHRASIVEKSKERALSGLPHVQWDYSTDWYK